MRARPRFLPSASTAASNAGLSGIRVAVVGYRSNMCDGRDHWLAGRLSPRWLDGLVIWEMSDYHVDAGRVGRQHAPMRCHEVEGMFLIPDGRCTVRFRGGEMTGLAPGIRHFLNPPDGLQLEPRNAATWTARCGTSYRLTPSPITLPRYREAGVASGGVAAGDLLMRQASLPMYNLPEMQAENTAFWLAIRTEAEQLGVMGLPPVLVFARKPVPARIEPDTVFTQVCGWPLQTIYAGQAMVLGVPAYDAAHCAGPDPCRRVCRAARRALPLRRRSSRLPFRLQQLHSNSGMNLPRRVIAELARRQAVLRVNRRDA